MDLERKVEIVRSVVRGQDDNPKHQDLVKRVLMELVEADCAGADFEGAGEVDSLGFWLLGPYELRTNDHAVYVWRTWIPPQNRLRNRKWLLGPDSRTEHTHFAVKDVAARLSF